MIRYLDLVRISVLNSFRLDTAFLFNNWANILSTVAYTITWLLFFEIVYLNTPELAGYNRNEMIFFVLIAQITFYMITGFLLQNIINLIVDVNTGHFDLVLSKPVPSLFYALIRSLRVFSTIRDALVPLTLMVFAIDFSLLNLQLPNLIVGATIMVIGILVSYLIALIASLPVFWLGESRGTYELAAFLLFDLADDIPYEGFAKVRPLQFILTAAVPVLLSTGLSTSVMLGKTAAIDGLLVAALATVAIILIANYLWHLALRNYSSASS